MEYLPIRVSTLRGDQKIDFSAYVRVNEKYIMYVRRGDSFEGSRLTRLKEKNLKKMFIKIDDEPTYRKYLERNIEIAYDPKSGKSMANRAEIVQGSQQGNAEEVFENPDSVENYNTCKTAAEKFVQFLQLENEAFASMMSIENVDQNMAHHGVTVSTLATMLAKKLNIADTKQSNLLALGGLLHDFDHFSNGLNLAKPLASYSKEEMDKYRNHPRSGAEKVKDKKHFDTQVIRIIMEHEEMANGTGFPQKLTEKQIDPLALIIGTCNAYDRIVTFENTPKKEAAKKLLVTKMGCYPLTHLNGLTDLLKNL